MFTDIRALADQFLIAFPNINTMHNIIFDTADVFVRGSVIDAFVNVIAGDLAGEATSDIISFS